jgi:hypothetical protein
MERSQASASFCTTTLNDQATCACAHTFTPAVCFCSFAIIWLKSSFCHDNYSIKLRLETRKTINRLGGCQGKATGSASILLAPFASVAMQTRWQEDPPEDNHTLATSASGVTRARSKQDACAPSQDCRSIINFAICSNRSVANPVFFAAARASLYKSCASSRAASTPYKAT